MTKRPKQAMARLGVALPEGRRVSGVLSPYASRRVGRGLYIQLYSYEVDYYETGIYTYIYVMNNISI